MVSRETVPWARVAGELGRHLSDRQTELLETFRDWLIAEAIPGGGLGPNEANRVDTRHLADSVLFSWFLDTPDEVWDLGSGVGLPGIPLAVLFPDTRVVLIDRSARRIDLAGRAIRVLGLPNAEVRTGDITRLEGTVGHVVSRASLPPEQLGEHAARLLLAGGTAVVGGSWSAPPKVEGWSTEEVVSDALDRTVWFLIMRRQ